MFFKTVAQPEILHILVVESRQSNQSCPRRKSVVHIRCKLGGLISVHLKTENLK
jgi:hypothetical protein